MSRSANVGSEAARHRGHGEFLRLWESSAPLADEAENLCARLETQVGNSFAFRASETISGPLKADVKTTKSVLENGCGLPSYEGADGLSGLASVKTAEEFHAWHAEMERRLKEANDEKFRSMLAGLTADRDACSSLLQTVQDARAALDAVKTKRAEVANLTERFRSDCENLVAGRKRMAELADALRRRLTYFEELETMTTKFSTGKDAIAPTDPDFVRLLHRLDECVAYASSSTGAVAEADGYVARFLEIQRRAFVIIRDHTTALIRSTAAQVAKELREERAAGAGFRHADITDASKEYLRFRTIAPRVKSLMTELHERAKAPNVRASPYRATMPPSAPTLYSNASYNGDSLFSSNATSGTGAFAGNPLFSTRNTAMTIYAECEECFLDQRRRLIEPSVSAHVKSLAEVRNMVALARLGSSYVLRVCHLEKQLYEHFFPMDSDSSESPALTSAISGVCDMLYRELRPQILQEDELDKLVYLIEVLKTEILGDEVPRRGAAGVLFSPAITRAVADAQERIIYRSEVFVRDEIRGFEPLPEHLDYPDRILQISRPRSRRQSSPQYGNGTEAKPEGFSENASDISAESKTSSQRNGDTDGAMEGTSQDERSSLRVKSSMPLLSVRTTPRSQETRELRGIGIYATWYPPVERTLRLLSMIYRCVDGQVFAGLAQEAVACCVNSVEQASLRIAASGKPHSEDHAQLFLIWQLLMTREQITPFDVEMTYTEHELDFSELRNLLGSVMRGHLSVRSLTTPPAIREKTMNSKQDLDLSARRACESFILKTTRSILGPILSFLAKCNAIPAGSTAAQKRPLVAGEVPVTPPPATAFETLKANKGSFAHPERLRSMWEMLEDQVVSSLPDVVSMMKIYILRPASRAVLLRPVRANIAEAVTELLSAMQLRYSLEERSLIGIDGTTVQRLLETVDEVTELTERTRTSYSTH